jgi:two-component system chemotaxis response regulator CheB
MNLLDLADELIAKIRALAGARPARLVAELAPAGHVPERALRGVEVVAIGTSTGGPPALQAIIPRLPVDFPSAVLIVQHMPVGFTKSLADRLHSKSLLPVREAADGDAVEAGQVLIAPAGRHMRVRRRGNVARVWLDDEPRAALHRPSVDVLMASVAKTYGARALGVVLTGMGSDGVDGLRAMREAGGRTLAESEETAVIYGMPKAAVEAGVVDKVVRLDRMADEILDAV